MTAVTLPMEETVIEASTANTSILGTYKRAPMEFVRGEGVELIDADGKRYLDFAGGIAVNSLGYGDPGIARVIGEALSTGLIHTSNLYRTSAGEQLADKLVECSFASKVFFCNSGAEANEGAFKFARRWARKIGTDAKVEIIALRGSFHGRLFASLAATDRPSYRAPFRPLAGAVSICERDLSDLETALDEETVAALIVEPVQGEGGVRVLDDTFLEKLRTLTAKREIALIFDEVQCGLGRTGHLFAYERSGVVPDMLTLAKPLAGGLPMGAVLLSEDIASTIQPGDHATTFGGGPLVAAVAAHVLERLSDPSLLESVREKGAWLGEQLDGIARRSGKVRAIRGTGFIWGLDVLEPAGDIVKRGWEEGILLLTAGEHTLRILPPLIMDRDDLVRGLSIIEKVIAQ
ncbi:MAG: acetylornithine/N-succinyldiaminopimelate aminotransferase [Gemmatimonadaceae bacterium]|jgi:predicted acetylornithine/succinylornithine family transaminase|nr:acetylornithine/N-succinyldiaminopimelate aminotransferase [Gemmatimonadaceae bacterium]